MNRLSHLYDRYLRGVDWGKAAQRIGAFYALMSCLFIHAGLSTEFATESAMAATAAGALLYLAMPKSKQALADNLLAEAQAHREVAQQITDRLVAAVEAHPGISPRSTASKNQVAADAPNADQ